MTTTNNNPALSVLKGYHVAANIVDGHYSELLFFIDKDTRDAWAKGYNPSLGSYDHDLAASRDIVYPDEYQYLFLGLSEDDIKRMLANATPDADNAGARVYRIDYEVAAIAKALEEYSIATFSDDGCEVIIYFFPNDQLRAEWLNGEGILEGEELAI